MDRLQAMRTFLRVVESGTFVKAADSMNLPKPTVTRLIQSLEAHLQTKLLNRTTRRVTVTADGAAYYERAQRLVGDIDELDATISRSKAIPSGRLRVDVGSSVGVELLIPALPDFFARYPRIQLELGVSDRPVDLMGEGVDCVLRGGEISDQSLVARRIGEFGFVTCATPEYLRRHGMPAHPRDLESERHTLVNYFSHRTGRIYPFDFSKEGERFEVLGRHAVSVNDSNAELEATLSGLGVARLATLTAQAHIDAGLLQVVLPDWNTQTVPIYVVYPPNRHVSAKLRVFVDWVADLFADSHRVHRPSGARRGRMTLPASRVEHAPLALGTRKKALQLAH
jgi:LysR family transcriptional regulator for bpeEF and oprC